MSTQYQMYLTLVFGVKFSNSDSLPYDYSFSQYNSRKVNKDNEKSEYLCNYDRLEPQLQFNSNY